MGDVLLSIENVSLRFGGVRAISDVSFDIRQASVHNEIGIMAVLLVGEQSQVIAAIEFLRSKGVTVEPIEKSDPSGLNPRPCDASTCPGVL